MADNTNCDQESSTTKLKLPISRIRSIMKCAPEISNLSQESVYVITKAAEMFVEYFIREAYDRLPEERGSIIYKELSNAVERDPALRFLSDIVPVKVLAGDYIDTTQK